MRVAEKMAFVTGGASGLDRKHRRLQMPFFLLPAYYCLLSEPVISTDQKTCEWQPYFLPIRQAGHIARDP